MRQNRVFLSWTLWLIVVIVLSGCRATADLGETRWALVAYGPADAPIPAEGGGSIHFDANGRMGGHDGCNAFFGHYEATDGRLAFRNDEMAFTGMDCDATTPQGRQDAFFRQWLPGGGPYEQTADRLTLFFDEGRQVAEYQKVTSDD